MAGKCTMWSGTATLVVLPISPWSERAKWALDHHGLAYEVIMHVSFLGERRLRKLVRRDKPRATVPVLHGLLAATFAFVGAGCAASGPAASNASVAASLYEAQQKEAERNLATFDDLDFNVFSGQRWDDLDKCHAANVVVHWPDGHTTQGIEKHVDDLKAMFAWAPDTRIEVHPIKVAQKDWTAVVGVMEGTFTKSMPLGDGTSIPPTGKAYKITMATFSHWTPEGPMDEEYLFWDNQEFMKEIGLGK